MNVKFPGFDTVWGFWVIMGSLIVTLVGLLGFFRYKRWL
jgi:Mg2+ and Co2+ transporter CorA